MQTRITRGDRPHLVDGARVYKPHYVNLCSKRCQLMSSFRLRWALDSGGGKTNTQVTNRVGGTESFITAETRELMSWAISFLLGVWWLGPKDQMPSSGALTSRVSGECKGATAASQVFLLKPPVPNNFGTAHWDLSADAFSLFVFSFQCFTLSDLGLFSSGRLLANKTDVFAPFSFSFRFLSSMTVFGALQNFKCFFSPLQSHSKLTYWSSYSIYFVTSHKFGFAHKHPFQKKILACNLYIVIDKKTVQQYIITK